MRHRPRRIAAAIALANSLAIVVAGAGCGGGATGARDDFLRIGASTSIDSLNPFVGQADYAYLTWTYVYPKLVQIDRDLRTAPDFAGRWETSRDGLTWTFHTRPNVKWSDGRPLTAHDAAWTIETARRFSKGPTAQVAQDVDHLVSARAADANTLVVTYDRAVANPLNRVGRLSILPRHVWEPHAAGDGSGLRSFPNSAPLVGGGPFVLRKHVKDQVAVFGRNPNWYGRKPSLSGFGLQFFSSSDAMILAIKTGGLDMVGEATPPTGAEVLRKAGLRVQTAPSVAVKTFTINTNPRKNRGRELLDPKVREALARAIDRDQIVRVAWLGYAKPGASIVAPALKDWNDPGLRPEPFDPDAAERLLDEAGYRKGSDGVRIAKGHRMSYTVIFSTEESGPGDRAFQIIQAGFRRIGVEITQRKLDLNATTQAIQAPDGRYLDFDLAMGDWVPDIDPDFILSVLTCDQFGGWNDSGFCDPAYDGLYRHQATPADVKRRREAVFKAQRLIYERRPYIVLVYPDIIEAHSRRWTGFVMSPLMGSVTSLSKETLLSVHRTK